jgi:hypothetical protein
LKNKSLKTYASLARIGFPKSYSAKIMLVVKHKVEALNQAYGSGTPKRAWGASGATGYRVSP